MKSSRNLRSIASLLILCSMGVGAWADAHTQTVTLNPGWNAVFLEVQPEPRDYETVFAGLQVDTVAMWVGDTSPIQFITDPDDLNPASPPSSWLMCRPSVPHTPPQQPPGTTLFSILGGRPYLVKSAAATPVQWTVTGKPVLRSIRWQPDSFNFTGFYVNSSDLPSFSNFFAASPAHADQPVWKLGPNGDWVELTNLSETIQKGTAYWVYTNGGSQYQGPVKVILEGSGLDYGKSSSNTERGLRLKNETDAEQIVTVESISVALTSPLVDNGDVLLSYWNQNATTNEFEWVDFSAPVTVTLGPHEEVPYPLAIRRAATIAGHPSTDEFFSLVSISGAGMKLPVPVSAHGNAQLYAGLWAGTATVNAVTEHLSGTVSANPLATGENFNFRLLVHVDAAGAAKLLQQVVQMWREPGEYILLTDDALITSYGAQLKNEDVPLAKRMSSPAFGFSAPIAMTAIGGAWPVSGAKFSCPVILDYNDPLNPFKHRYHPDHNNLEGDYATVKAEGTESFTVTRTVELEFTAYDPAGLSQSGWGDAVIGGIYRETITGLMKDKKTAADAPGSNAVKVSGYFRLTHVSDIAQLNPTN